MVTKIKVFAHTLSCSPQNKSEQMVEHIISTRIICDDLEQIISTRILLVTSTRIICGDLEQITSTRILLVISSRSPRPEYYVVTSSTSPRSGCYWSPRPRSYQKARFSQNIFSEILGTIFLVGWKLVVFLRILGERIKTAIVSYKNRRKGILRGLSFSLSLSLSNWTHGTFFSLYHREISFSPVISLRLIILNSFPLNLLKSFLFKAIIIKPHELWYHLNQNIFSEILGTIFLVGSKLVIFLRILEKRIKPAIISYKNPGKMGEMGDSFSSVPLGDWIHWIFFLSLPLINFSFAYDFFKINYFQLFSFKFT